MSTFDQQFFDFFPLFYLKQMFFRLQIVWKSRFGLAFRNSATNSGEEGTSIMHENIWISLVRVRKQELGCSGRVHHSIMEWSITITVFCIGIGTMIQEQLNVIQIGAMATKASIVQGRNLAQIALRTGIDVGSRYNQLLC
jgi:hypothetical protein